MHTGANLPTQLIRVRQETPGSYTAEVLGLPELQATAGSADEAVRTVQERLQEWVASGRLVPVELASVPPVVSPPRDPTDPLEREFLEDLARFLQQDLERTLQEYDQGYSRSSSAWTS